MIWTHIYDLLLKLTTLFLSIILLIQIPYLGDNSMLVVVLGVILFFILYNLFVRTLSTYLYCKFTLKMNVNLSQAKQLNEAYTPIFPFTMKWLPMEELKEIDSADRFQIALDTYKNWNEKNTLNRKQQLQDFKNTGQRTKVLTVIMYVLLGYFMIAGFMDLPPANYLTVAYRELFNTDSYYPILNCFILTLPTILIFKTFDKNIK